MIETGARSGILSGPARPPRVAHGGRLPPTPPPVPPLQTLTPATFCPSCGFTAGPDARFCPNCATPVVVPGGDPLFTRVRTAVAHDPRVSPVRIEAVLRVVREGLGGHVAEALLTVVQPDVHDLTGPRRVRVHGQRVVGRHARRGGRGRGAWTGGPAAALHDGAKGRGRA